MRSKYAEYPEYHTSEDDLNLVSAKGLQGSFDTHVDILKIFEKNNYYVASVLGEPQLSTRNLRPSFGAVKGLSSEFKIISDVLAYADGSLDLVDIANKLNVYVLDLIPIVDKLLSNNLLKTSKV